jgi:hypothetical protein
MCRNTVPTLRVLQNWSSPEEGKSRPTTYALQTKDAHGHWVDIPVVNKYPPVQMELPFEDRPST